jgi:hypothetical protein
MVLHPALLQQTVYPVCNCCKGLFSDLHISGVLTFKPRTYASHPITRYEVFVKFLFFYCTNHELISSDMFSGSQSCQCGVSIQHFGHSQFHHQGLMQRALHPPTDIYIMEQWTKPDGSCSISGMYWVNRQHTLWYEYNVGTQPVVMETLTKTLDANSTLTYLITWKDFIAGSTVKASKFTRIDFLIGRFMKLSSKISVISLIRRDTNVTNFVFSLLVVS